MDETDPGISVRAPRREDLARVVALEKRCFADPWEAEALEQELATDHLRLPLVAEVAGKVAGYLMAWKIVDQLHILNLATDPDLRRRGVGAALLLAAARKAVELGMEEVTLEVRESNRQARAFYQAYGFVPTGVRPGYYADNGEDAIIMTTGVRAILDT
ncbi:MAG: ribosomal protein S18-alanine N-acetyltransferase [Candidatus Krumholzibacteriota bacterium]